MNFIVVIQALQLFFIWFVTFFFNPFNNALTIISKIMFTCTAVLFPVITMICVLVFQGNGAIKDTTMGLWFWIYFSLQAIILLFIIGGIIVSCIVSRKKQADG